MNKKRLIDILKILINKNDFISVKNIAKILNVSEKTIRNDINELIIFLKIYNIQIEKVPSKGIKLNNINIVNIKNIIKNPIKTNFNSKDRRKLISLNLLIFNEIRLKDIINKLYISKSTVNNDLNIIKNEFKKYKINIIRKNNNINILAKEKNIRMAIFDIFINSRFYFEYEKLYNYINENDFQILNKFIDYVLNMNIRSGLNKNKLIIFLKKLKNEIENYFPFENLKFKIFLIFLISIIRIKQKYDIYIINSNFYDYKQFQNEINKIYEKLKYNNIYIDNHEKHYIQIYLICLIEEKNFYNNNILKENIKKFANNLINFYNYKKKSKIPFDNYVQNLLCNFLAISKFRMNYGIFLKNECDSLINDNDFYIIKKFINNSNFYEVINNDEIYYLTVILNIFEKKYKNKQKILLISSENFMIKNYIKYKLESLFNINVIIEKDFNETFDLLITTDNNKNGLFITSKLNENDIIKISRKLNELSK